MAELEPTLLVAVSTKVYVCPGISTPAFTIKLILFLEERRRPGVFKSNRPVVSFQKKLWRRGGKEYILVSLLIRNKIMWAIK